MYESKLQSPVLLVSLTVHPAEMANGRKPGRYLGIDGSEHGGCPSRLNPADTEGLRPRGQVGVRDSVGNLMRHGRRTLPVEPWPLFHLEAKKKRKVLQWVDGWKLFCCLVRILCSHLHSHFWVPLINSSSGAQTLHTRSTVLKKLLSVRVSTSSKHVDLTSCHPLFPGILCYFS